MRLPGKGCEPGWAAPLCAVGASTAGIILLRASESCVCDDEGVAWAEPDGEWEAPSKGEAVPGAGSFFLDDLLSLSLLRESCSD